MDILHRQHSEIVSVLIEREIRRLERSETERRGVTIPKVFFFFFLFFFSMGYLLRFRAARINTLDPEGEFSPEGETHRDRFFW